jgi:hypothetical protein
MDNKKMHACLIGLIIVLGVGVVLSVQEANSLLVKQSKTLSAAKAKDLAADNQRVQLVQDKKDVEKYADLNQIAKSVVPQDKNQAEAVREIVNLATKSGISQLSSITFPPSTLGGASTSKQNGLTQVTAVKGISGVYDLPITVTQSTNAKVPYSNFVSFLSKLEQNRRTAQVSSISIEPDPSNSGQVSFTLTIDEFIKP